MKASVETAVSGIQALQVQRRSRNAYRAKASYVDETLFGSHAAPQAVVMGFDPPWVNKKPGPQRPLLWSPAATRWEADAGSSKAPGPPSTPRNKNKYRLKSRTPSYCDETLFGAKSRGQNEAVPWMKEEEAAKLHPLLWTSPPTSRNLSSLSSCQKKKSPRPVHRETPRSWQTEKSLRAVHRETPRSWQTDGFEARYGEHPFWKIPENNSDEDDQGALGWAGYQPVGRAYCASDTFQPPETHPRTNRQQDRDLPDASVAFPGSKPHPKGILRPSSARLSRATGSCKPRPPWK